MKKNYRGNIALYPPLNIDCKLHRIKIVHFASEASENSKIKFLVGKPIFKMDPAIEILKLLRFCFALTSRGNEK